MNKPSMHTICLAWSGVVTDIQAPRKNSAKGLDCVISRLGLPPTDNSMLEWKVLCSKCSPQEPRRLRK